MERLCAAKNCSHAFDSCTDDVVVRVLLSERPSTCLAVGAEHVALLVFDIEVLVDELGPEHTGCSQLCDFHVEVHTHGKEE